MILKKQSVRLRDSLGTWWRDIPLIDGGEDDDGYVPSGPCSILFDHLEDDFLHEELGLYPLEEINNNKMLPLLIYVQLRREVAEMESESEATDSDGPTRRSSERIHRPRRRV